MEWWITEAGNQPIGPVTAELILRGLEAGKVPLGALVCEVGGTAWRPLAEVEPFASAAQRQVQASLDRGPGGNSAPERTLVDLDFSADEAAPLLRFDGTSERTVVEPALPPPSLARFEARPEDGEERTIVERLSLPSEGS